MSRTVVGMKGTEGLGEILARTLNEISQAVYAPLHQELGGLSPNLPIVKLMKVLNEVHAEITSSYHPDGVVFASAEYLPYLKMAIVSQRLRVTSEVAALRNKVSSPEAVEMLQRRLDVFRDLMKMDWFGETVAARYPQLTDVLTIEQATKLSDSTLPSRQFDEKFHILQAPDLWPKDLTYYRTACGLRDAPICLAFLDIDDFKAFNTELSYPVVDLIFLPRFMSLLEGHVFGRGHAYRIGGDEYVVILPNADAAAASRTMALFQDLLKPSAFPNVPKTVTVSIGIAEVWATNPLTNQEIYSLAEAAKDKAKATKKGTIVVMHNPYSNE